MTQPPYEWGHQAAPAVDNCAICGEIAQIEEMTEIDDEAEADELGVDIGDLVCDDCR